MSNSVVVSKDLLDFLDSLPEPRLVLGSDYRIIASNKAYQKFFGEGKPINGKHCYEVSHHFLKPCDQQGEACPLKVAKETKTTHRVFHIHHTPRGREHVDVGLTPILGANGEPAFYIETIRKQEYISTLPNPETAVGKSPSFVRMLGMIERVAASDTPALLLGETGTGKEVMASILHKKSDRSKSALIIVDCAGLTETLFESELFGHEKGSFTGAFSEKKGLVEMAHGGTLFLDEVGEIPLSQQVKLLRLLETSTYRKVGGLEVKRANFRLVCATHRNLKRMVEEGSFRQDLYFRINAFPINLPALRDRKEDISLLAESLLNRLSPVRKFKLSQAAHDFITDYPFLGNIRELRNMLERAILLADTDIVHISHLIEDSNEVQSEVNRKISKPNFHGEILPLNALESRYLQWAVGESNESKKDLASKLGLTTRTFYRKLNELKKETLN
jgi:transcriptional regulator with PAS, ATPase and Fis domain